MTRRLPARLSPRPVRAVIRHLWASAALRQSVAGAYWPAVVCSGLFLGAFLGLLTRGQYVAWDGIHSIPTGGAR